MAWDAYRLTPKEPGGDKSITWYSDEIPNDKKTNNKDEEPDWYVTSKTEGSPDNGYKCTIRSIKYGAIWGFGQTAKEAEEDAHRQYEHLKSKW